MMQVFGHLLHVHCPPSLVGVRLGGDWVAAGRKERLWQPIGFIREVVAKGEWQCAISREGGVARLTNATGVEAWEGKQLQPRLELHLGREGSRSQARPDTPRHGQA